MNREEAREYVISCGIDVTTIREAEIQILYMMLTAKIKKFSKSDWEVDEGCYLEVSKKIEMKKNKNGTVKSCYLSVNSHYFKQREAICIDGNGFIGFAGWSDDHNVAPIIEAFIEWCDWMKG